MSPAGKVTIVKLEALTLLPVVDNTDEEPIAESLHAAVITGTPTGTGFTVMTTGTGALVHTPGPVAVMEYVAVMGTEPVFTKTSDIVKGFDSGTAAPAVPCTLASDIVGDGHE